MGAWPVTNDWCTTKKSHLRLVLLCIRIFMLHVQSDLESSRERCEFATKSKKLRLEVV